MSMKKKNVFNYINPKYYYNNYKERVNKYKKLEELDKKYEDLLIKDYQAKQEELKKNKELLNEKIIEEKNYDEKKRRTFITKLEKHMKENLLKKSESWINKFGVYSYRFIDNVYFKTDDNITLGKKDLHFLNKKIERQDLNRKDSQLEYLWRLNKRHQLNYDVSDAHVTITTKDTILYDALRRMTTGVSSKENEEKYKELIESYANILLLKTKLRNKLDKKIWKKRNFLTKVLRVLLYVEERDAEILNEQFAKIFFYTRDVNYNFRVRSNNIKVRSLEWTVSSPPPLHTFYIPVRTIVTNDRFYNYKKGKRLLENKYYNFKETPSVFQKALRKLTKTYFLFFNYLAHVFKLKNFEKDPNLWYSGSYNVEEVEEYPHTVEYVSQSIRYPYKRLSKYLPFTAGLHENTISIDLLITPDKSNRVIFGEKKKYLSKPTYLKKNKKIIKPLFILGDRNNYLTTVNVKNIKNNYNNYLIIYDYILNELKYKGDGVYVSYYLPDIKDSFHSFLWLNTVYEDPATNNYFHKKIDTFNLNPFTWDEKIDLKCLGYDLEEKVSKKWWKNIPFTVKMYYTYHKLRQNNQINNYVADWYDQSDFSWTVEYFYFYFYIPYKLACKVNKKYYFFKYILKEYLFKPILGYGWINCIKMDLFAIKQIYKKLK